ncbi:LysR family transcriptional regulator [Pseudomonas sp. M47T1]|uniref:LysR family transcriptional regulator n=1 Tax=Pseudomonas sp. M47T1 TaxID=1179778 RepID=UPI0005BBB5D7|nr:LysR family transcriptional regulator [Pseudomonas sp. M47T1]
MQLTRANLADFMYFLAVGRHLSFSRAGLEVGISASALSHAIKALEARLGVRLLNRTTRNVTLTAAGQELLELINDPIDRIDQAMDVINRYRDEPAGRIRLNIFSDAALLLLAPVLPVFGERYPDIEIDISISNTMVDVVEGGFDAGMRFGATVPEGMIAHRLSPDIRWVVAGTAEYLRKWGTPEHPEDLKRHQCMKFKIGTGKVYDWEFEKDGERLAVSVFGGVILDETRIALALACESAGLIYAAEPVLAPYLKDGSLQLVLEDWASVSPGFHIYYSSYRQQPLGLRLLIDMIREIAPLG